MLKKLLISILIIVFLLPTLITAINFIIQSNNLEAPAFFLNVDNTYFYSYVHSFTKNPALWPYSLGSNLEGYGYYWAPVYLAAIFTLITGLPSYYSYFVILPILSYAVFALAALRQVNESKSSNVILALSVLLFCRVFVISIHPDALFELLFLREKPFFGNNSVLQMNIIMAGPVVLLIAYSSYRSKSSLKDLIVSRLLLIILCFIKMPYVPILLLVIGFTKTLPSLLKRKFINTLVDFLVFVGICFIYFYVIKNEIGTFDYILEYSKYWSFKNELSFALGFNFLNLKVFIPLVVLVIHGWILELQLNKESRLTSVWLVFSLILFGSLLLRWENPDRHQLLAPLGLLVPFFIARSLLLSTSRVRLRLYLPLVLFCISSFIGSIVYSSKVLLNVNRSTEYVDNRELLSILRLLPVEGTLLATNDTRNPANNFIRGDKQFQIPGLYGHNCFNCDQVYRFMYWNGSLEDRKKEIFDRRYVTNLLQKESLEKIDYLDLKKYGISHILIHKNYQHASGLNQGLVKETDNYLLYELK